MSISPIESNILTTLEGVLLSSPAGQVVDDLVDALGTLGLLEQSALALVSALEAKLGFGPDVGALLRSKLTAEGARIAQLQADGLEAARLAELAGSK